jgi:hypothetical protein
MVDRIPASQHTLLNLLNILLTPSNGLVDKVYPRDAFTFSADFIRLGMPISEGPQVIGQVTRQVTVQVTEQVGRVVNALAGGPLTSAEIQQAVGLKP